MGSPGGQACSCELEGLCWEKQEARLVLEAARDGKLTVQVVDPHVSWRQA